MGQITASFPCDVPQFQSYDPYLLHFIIVLPRSNDHVYICLFVNIQIKTSGWYIQQSGVVLKTIRYQPDSSVGKVLVIRKSNYFPLCAGFESQQCLHLFSTALLINA